MIPFGIMVAPIFEPQSGLPYENRVHICIMTVYGHYSMVLPLFQKCGNLA
jgi:hypothetical protein